MTYPELIIVGDEAWTREEYEARQSRLETQRAYYQRPDVRARRAAYHREWKERNRDRVRAYNREWMRQYRATHPDYLERHRERERERQRVKRAA